MTILTSLLIATQGLLPSPTPLSIGSQGLLQPGAAPPPIVQPPDLPGGGGRKEKERIVVVVRGNQLRITSAFVRVTVSTHIEALGASTRSRTTTPAQSVSTALEATGNSHNLAASRLRPHVSTAFEIVGCREEDEAQIRALAQAALEQVYLDHIVAAYDD
jgi:hypothetical protein